MIACATIGAIGRLAATSHATKEKTSKRSCPAILFDPFIASQTDIYGVVVSITSACNIAIAKAMQGCKDETGRAPGLGFGEYRQ